MSTVQVRRDGPEPDRPWRATVVAPDRELLAGFYPTHPEALMRGISAARFADAGVTWTPEGLPDEVSA